MKWTKKADPKQAELDPGQPMKVQGDERTRTVTQNTALCCYVNWKNAPSTPSSTVLWGTLLLTYTQLVIVCCVTQKGGDMENGEKLYTAREFAKMMRCSRAWVYELVRTGKIPAYKLGQAIRIPHSAIELLRFKVVEEPVVISDKLECIDELGDLEVLDDL